MKNILIIIFLALSALPSNAQSSKIHIPASESIIGIWRQTGIVNPNNGELVDLRTGNYKVINPDGTYFTFVTWGTGNPKKSTTIGQYGSFEIKSDSTLVEKIIKHVMYPKLNGKSGIIKYKLIDENTLMMAWKNENGIWVNEQWTRLPLKR